MGFGTFFLTAVLSVSSIWIGLEFDSNKDLRAVDHGRSNHSELLRRRWPANVPLPPPHNPNPPDCKAVNEVCTKENINSWPNQFACCDPQARCFRSRHNKNYGFCQYPGMFKQEGGSCVSNDDCLPSLTCWYGVCKCVGYYCGGSVSIPTWPQSTDRPWPTTTKAPCWRPHPWSICP